MDVFRVDGLGEAHFGQGLGNTDYGLQLPDGDGNIVLFLPRKLVLFGFLAILDVEILEDARGFLENGEWILVGEGTSVRRGETFCFA